MVELSRITRTTSPRKNKRKWQKILIGTGDLDLETKGQGQSVNLLIPKAYRYKHFAS